LNCNSNNRNRIWDPYSRGYEFSVFCDITPCSPLKVNWHFGRAFCLQFQGRRVSQSPSCWFLAWLIIRPYKLMWYIPPTLRSALDRLYVYISQKVKVFSKMLSVIWEIILASA
jgi:hypothetical protein